MTTVLQTNQERAAEALDRAVDLINEFGWTRGVYGNEQCGFCSLGALDAATFSSFDVYDLAADALQDAIGGNIVAYNDDIAKDKRYVIRKMRAAAKDLRSRP